MNALLLSLLVAPPALGPELLPGTNEWFQQGMVAAMRDLEKGSFPSATARLSRMPDLNVTLTWDAKGLSATQKSEFAAARDRALASWREIMPELKVSIVPTGGELTFSFVTTLPPNPESVGPAGAVFLSSLDSKGPSLETVIALKRGGRAENTVGRDVNNEVVYALGAHLGLARIPIPGFAMYRSEEPYREWLKPVRSQTALVTENLSTVEKLRAFAKAKTRITPALPRIATQPLRYDAKPTIQGAPLDFSIQMTNQGTAPLRYLVVPDCGCFSVRQGAPIKRGETIAIPVSINTMDFPGKHDKVLYIYTNDPEDPVRVFPVTFNALPRYRFLWDEPTDVLQVEENGRTVTVYLTFEGEKPMNVKGMRLNGGATGLVDFEPWTGTLADPFFNEPARARKGYKIEILFGPEIGEGRKTLSLEVETDDPVFQRLQFPFYLQKGIVALPQFVYIGQLKTGQAAQASARISRPGKPFKVLRVETDSPLLMATPEAIPGRAEFRINFSFKGSVDPGEFKSKVTVHTDDPKQPTIIVEVSGMVR